MFAADSLDQPSDAGWEAQYREAWKMRARRLRYITDLRALADFLAGNPDVLLPTNHLQHSVLQHAGGQSDRYTLAAQAAAACGVRSVGTISVDAYACRAMLWQGNELTYSIHAPSDASFAAGPIGGEWHDRVQAQLAAAVLTPDDPNLPDVEA